MILIFGSIEWEKQNTLSNVGEPHLISWRLEYKKMADFPTKIRELLLDALTWYFPIFGLELKPWLFQGHEPADLQIGTYTISSPGAQVFRLRLELYFWLSIVSSLLTADLLVLFPVELWIIHRRTLNNTPWLSWLTWQNVIGSQGLTGAYLGPSVASIKLD